MPYQYLILLTRPGVSSKLLLPSIFCNLRPLCTLVLWIEWFAGIIKNLSFFNFLIVGSLSHLLCSHLHLWTFFPARLEEIISLNLLLLALFVLTFAFLVKAAMSFKQIYSYPFSYASLQIQCFLAYVLVYTQNSASVVRHLLPLLLLMSVFIFTPVRSSSRQTTLLNS